MAKTASKIKFQAKLQRPVDGGDWTFLRLPQDASDQVPTRNMKSVEGTLNGSPFQATLQPDSNGGHWLKVDEELSREAKVKPGDTVELDIAPMAVELEPDVPEDLQRALDANPKAMETWIDTTSTARRDWVSWMVSGKKPETRTLHIEKMMDMLSKGKKRVCCYDRSGMASGQFVCPMPADDELD